jgi:hypothetical protein
VRGPGRVLINANFVTISFCVAKNEIGAHTIVGCARGRVNLQNCQCFETLRVPPTGKGENLSGACSYLVRRVHLSLGLVFIASAALLAACSPPFGSFAQQQAFYGMSGEMWKIQSDNRSRTVLAGSPGGLLAVFDTNGDGVTTKYLIDGETAEGAMFALIKSHVADPCISDGPNPRIVGFAPPPAVDLPISFVRCSTLRDQVKLMIAEKSALRNLLAASKNNRKDLDRVAADLAKISNVQEASWKQAIDILSQLSQQSPAGAGR